MKQIIKKVASVHTYRVSRFQIEGKSKGVKEKDHKPLQKRVTMFV